MKKLFIASGLVVLLLLPVGSSITFAARIGGLATMEPAVDYDFVVLAQNSSTTVTADLAFPLDFQIIPVVLVGNGNATGAFSASLSRNNTKGEIVYIYQKFPGAYAFNIGITPVTIRVSSAVTIGDDGWVFGYAITGILFSTETPPFGYSVSLGF